MVAVTERAKDALLRKKIAANIGEPDVGLRVMPDPTGNWTLVADRPRSDDRVIEHQGSTILVIGPDVEEILAGARVDCMPTPQGADELVLSRPRPDDGAAG